MRTLAMLVAIPAISAGALLAPAAPASAAPKTAAQTVAENGVYFWVDGLYEQVKLPAYGLGLHNLTLGLIEDLGPTHSFNQRLGGGGVRAGLGYAIPGTATRFEFGGSYIDAGATQSSSTTPAPLAGGLLLNGVIADAMDCTTRICSAAGVLRTDYRAWSFNGKAETDWTYGSVTLTPSFAVFGGNTRADQTFSQAFKALLVLLPASFANYSASTKLDWRDLGARAGLHVSSAVTPSFIIGWGGSVGVAARSVSFSGSDVANSSGFDLLFVGSSALTLADHKTVLLANAEANVTWHLTPAMSLTGFAGLHYDGDVPGIAGPSFTGRLLIPRTASGSAASLIYESQTSLYAGGGLVVKFGGTR